MATKQGRKNKLEKVDYDNVKGLYKSENAQGQLEYFGKVKIRGVIHTTNLTKKYNVTSLKKVVQKLDDWKYLLRNDDPSVSPKGKKTNFNTLDFMFLEQFVPNLKGEEKKKTYTSFYKNHIQKEIGNKKFDEIKHDDVQRIVDKLENIGRLSRRSLKKVQETLRPFYNELISDNKINYNPAIRIKYSTPLKNERNLTHILTHEDLTIPLRHILEEVEKIEDKKLKLMFYILIYCGRRFGEVQQIEWDNVVLEESFIIVFWDDNKSNNTTKFFINDKIINLMKEVKSENPKDKYVFESSIKRKDKTTPYIADSTLRDKHREIVKKLESENKIKFLPKMKYSNEAKDKDKKILNLMVHDYRHFLGTILHEYITDMSIIKSLLAHTNTDITARYSQVSFKTSKEVLKLYLRLLEGEKIDFKLQPVFK